MNKSIFALIALSAVTLGLSSCCKQVTIIETSDNVTHPMLHKGDTLVFQVPKQTYVHFDATAHKHPCTETRITWDKKGNPPYCKIVEAPTMADSFYLYLIDTDPTEKPMTASSGKCPTWCPGTLVIGAASGSAQDKTPAKWLQQSDPYPVVEVDIFNLIGVPNPANANLGQRVTWINPGTDAPAWTVNFADKNVCQEGQTIPTADSIYCTISADTTLPGYHSYTITVNGVTGPTSQLYVIPPMPTPAPTPK